MTHEMRIQEAGRRLIEATGGSAQIILFGSQARGEATPDSDLDFLVIAHHVTDRMQESVRLRSAIGDIGVPVDVVVLDKAVASRRAKVPGTIVHHALRDGRVLH
jgi:predicted nucleotidyltransferase